METTDVYELGVQLVEKLGMPLLVPYLGGADKVQESGLILIKLTDSLLSSYSNILFGKPQKIDKIWERRVKEIFYRLQTLVHEVEVFLEEGEHPNSILESFRSAVGVDMELIFDELRTFPAITYASENVVGGDEYVSQKEKLINMLLNSDSDRVVAILGKPGSGKSTLARLIMDDSRVREYFESRAFISLSYTSCQHDIWKVIKSGGEMSRSSDWPVQVHNLLGQLNRAKRLSCLTVLDDLSDKEILESLLSSKILTELGASFKIIVTSNLELLSASAISMPALSEEESRDLFLKKLPPTVSLRMRDDNVYDRIMKSCANIPSVISTVASILSTKDTVEDCEHFIEMVHTNIPNATDTISSIFVLTELHCHHQIQKNWRHCFAWCSLIPNDYEFGKDCIFHLWRAQDVFCGNQSMTEEELDQCFDEFITREYFLEAHTTSSTVTYKISYLVSELMKYVAGDDFCLCDKPTTQPKHTIRHASFIVDSFWEPPTWLTKAKHLQSILLWPRSSGDFIFSSKTYFNPWHMTDQRTLPNEVVVHEGSPILEYLRNHDISNISLPEDIPVFKRMAMYCGEEQRIALLVKFTGFRKLRVQSETSNEPYRQTSNLHLFVVNNVEIDGCEKFDRLNAANVNGIWVRFRSVRPLKLSNALELASLPEGFECVTTLERLSLCWLTNLTSLPQWIGKFTHLRHLALHYCLKLRMLPNCTDSFSALEQLEIWYCPRLSQFPASFPNLKTLRVQEFSRLEKILRVSQNLEEVEIENCEELDMENHAAEIWEGLTKLKSLKLTKMNRLPKDFDFNKVTKLRRLVIQNCPEFVTLPESLCSLSHLEYLQIQRCPGLIELPMSFSNLKSLKALEILDSPVLVNKFQEPISDGDSALIKHIPNVVCKSLDQQIADAQQK